MTRNCFLVELFSPKDAQQTQRDSDSLKVWLSMVLFSVGKLQCRQVYRISIIVNVLFFTRKNIFYKRSNRKKLEVLNIVLSRRVFKILESIKALPFTISSTERSRRSSLVEWRVNAVGWAQWQSQDSVDRLWWIQSVAFLFTKLVQDHHPWK